MQRYAAEQWTDDEAEILRRYFTNLDQPVFALVNLPEVVRGALFARYSRSAKSLRRLFLDEFVGDLDISGDHSIDATVGLVRAEELYDRVFMAYGDDSVAQLGGVHLACEQASNLLTKILERGRLMSYLEQSTRYIAFDQRLPNGHYRYHRPAEILDSPLGARYVGDMDRLFDSYAALLPIMQNHFAAQHPKDPADSDFVWRQAVRAKAFDALRGMLPAAATSNVGMYGSAQAYEALLLRMRAHPLPEARDYAAMMLLELRKVIPSFLKRVDMPARGGAWSDYLQTNSAAMQDVADSLLVPARSTSEATQTIGERPIRSIGSDPEVVLVDWDPDAEVKAVVAMIYPFSHASDAVITDRVRRLSDAERVKVMRAYSGKRSNRRHRPGRALERSAYRFDVLSDYGAFRDLQRHRMLTVEWQDLSPHHGYSLPGAVIEAGAAGVYVESMERSMGLFETLQNRFGAKPAGYAVCLAYRIRYSMQMNAREAMHVLELRTGPQGHPEYRKICQQMHRLIGEQAGHRSIAALMSFVDHDDYDSKDLERLEPGRRAEQRRLGAASNRFELTGSPEANREV